MTDSGPEAQPVRAQLARLCDCAAFVRAGRMHPLLEYLVEAEIAGQGEALNQYRIAIDVFGRSAEFDPSLRTAARIKAMEVITTAGAST